MYKEDLIQNIHKLYREDPWTQEIFKSAGIELDAVENAINDIEKQFWFDEMTWAIPIMETILNFKTNPLLKIEDRRSQLEAKWKANGKADIYLLQQVARSWGNGEADVQFVDGKIKLIFNGIYGVPNDLEGLLNIMDDVKPAHLALIYAFNYLLVKDIHNIMKINELETVTLNKFAGGI